MKHIYRISFFIATGTFFIVFIGILGRQWFDGVRELTDYGYVSIVALYSLGISAGMFVSVTIVAYIEYFKSSNSTKEFHANSAWLIWIKSIFIAGIAILFIIGILFIFYKNYESLFILIAYSSWLFFTPLMILHMNIKDYMYSVAEKRKISFSKLTKKGLVVSSIAAVIASLSGTIICSEWCLFGFIIILLVVTISGTLFSLIVSFIIRNKNKKNIAV